MSPASTATQVGGTYHGKGGTRTQFDGMSVQNMTGNAGYQLNAALVQEMTLQSSGISAEGNAEGVLINMIPKEGGNTFSGSVGGLYTNEHLAGDNLTDELRAAASPPSTFPSRSTTRSVTRRRSDHAGTVCGSSPRTANGATRTSSPGPGGTRRQGTPFYTPDLDRPATRKQWFESHAARVTWQATQAHKFNFFADVQDACICRTGTTSGVGQAPESINAYHFRPTGFYQTSWSAPITSRLLMDGSVSATINDWPQFRSPGVHSSHISILEQSTGMRYNAKEVYDDPNEQDRFGQRFAVSYVTGSHALKFGVQDEQGMLRAFRQTSDSNVSYTFNNQIPVSLTQYATPYLIENRFRHDLGVYAQDQWAIDRLTLNLGVRFDYFNGYVPAQDIPATPNGWVPARHYDRVDDVPSWTDLSPRLGAAYDLVRRRPHGAEGVVRPLRRQDRRRDRQRQQPDRRVGEPGDALVERRQRQLRSRLQPGQSSRERRVRRAREPQLRQPRAHDALFGRRAARVRRAPVQLGHERGSAAPGRYGDVRHRGVLPELVRQLPGHRQPVGHAVRLQDLLRDRSGRFATARRRRIRRCAASPTSTPTSSAR